MISELTVDRRRSERRSAVEPSDGANTENTAAADADGQQQPQRRKVERRRQIDPTTCERDYNNDEIEFMQAMDKYKRRSGRQFPTWSEVLEVLHNIGYRKVAEPTEIYGKP